MKAIQKELFHIPSSISFFWPHLEILHIYPCKICTEDRIDLKLHIPWGASQVRFQITNTFDPQLWNYHPKVKTVLKYSLTGISKVKLKFSIFSKVCCFPFVCCYVGKRVLMANFVKKNEKLWKKENFMDHNNNLKQIPKS
jgi:hypothetical protein